MAKKPYTLALSKKYLEVWGGWYFQKYLNEVLHLDTKIFISRNNSDIDKILKIDLLNTDNHNLNESQIKNRKKSNLITGNVKTHESTNSESFSFHPQELDNNDYLIFYEKPINENEIIENKYLTDVNALVKYLNESYIYVISTDKIKELMLNRLNNINDRGSNGEYYVIPLKCVKNNSYRYMIGK